MTHGKVEEAQVQYRRGRCLEEDEEGRHRGDEAGEVRTPRQEEERQEEDREDLREAQDRAPRCPEGGEAHGQEARCPEEEGCEEEGCQEGRQESRPEEGRREESSSEESCCGAQARGSRASGPEARCPGSRRGNAASGNAPDGTPGHAASPASGDALFTASAAPRDAVLAARERPELLGAAPGPLAEPCAGGSATGPDLYAAATGRRSAAVVHPVDPGQRWRRRRWWQQRRQQELRHGA
jgi:hypothetical protein